MLFRWNAIKIRTLACRQSLEKAWFSEAVFSKKCLCTFIIGFLVMTVSLLMTKAVSSRRDKKSNHHWYWSSLSMTDLVSSLMSNIRNSLILIRHLPFFIYPFDARQKIAFYHSKQLRNKHTRQKKNNFPLFSVFLQINFFRKKMKFCAALQPIGVQNLFTCTSVKSECVLLFFLLKILFLWNLAASTRFTPLKNNKFCDRTFNILLYPSHTSWRKKTSQFDPSFDRKKFQQRKTWYEVLPVMKTSIDLWPLGSLKKAFLNFLSMTTCVLLIELYRPSKFQSFSQSCSREIPEREASP